MIAEKIIFITKSTVILKFEVFPLQQSVKIRRTIFPHKVTMIQNIENLPTISTSIVELICKLKQILYDHRKY